MPKDDKSLTFNAEFGKHLVESARESLRNQLAEKCKSEVETTISLITLTKQRIEDLNTLLKLYQRRLEAIENGHVRIEPSAAQVTGLVIKYTDPELWPENNGGR